MKFNKIIAALLLVVLVLACLPVSAQQERVLTLKRAVQVNDTQIVLEFSEPIAINLHQQNRGPYCPIRLISSSGGTTRFNNEKHLQHPNYNTILQWQGSLRFPLSLRLLRFLLQSCQPTAVLLLLFPSSKHSIFQSHSLP